MSTAATNNPPVSFFARAGRVWLLSFALINIAMFWRLHDLMLDGYGDFASFYTAGQIVRSGQTANLFDRALQWKIQHQFAAKVEIRRGPLPFIRPPFEALLFVPFAYLSYPVACMLWLVLNLVLLLLTPLWLPRFDGVGFTLAEQMLVSLSYFPAAFCLIQGQDAVLLLIIVLFSLRLLLRGSEVECGAILGLGLFKFHLVLPLLAIFLLRKRFKVVGGFVATAIMLLGISLLMVHASGLINYPKYLWSMNEIPGLGMVTKTKSMPNVRGLLAVLLGTRRFPALIHLLLGIIICLGVVAGTRSWRGNDRRSLIAAYCCWVALILASAYYSNSYDLTLLLLPLLLFVKGFWNGVEFSDWQRRIFLFSTGLLLCTPLLWILALPVDQFGWTELILLAYAISIFVAGQLSTAEPKIGDSGTI